METLSFNESIMLIIIDDQLINLDYVQYITPSCGGKYEIYFTDGNVGYVTCTKDEMLSIFRRLEESQ